MQVVGGTRHMGPLPVSMFRRQPPVMGAFFALPVTRTIEGGSGNVDPGAAPFDHFRLRYRAR